MSNPIGDARVPDLWYDLYSRVIPGSLFVAALRWLVIGDPADMSAAGMLWIVALGFVCGFFMQPVGSMLARIVERKRDPNQLVDAAQKKLIRESRQSMILSKMHGEVSLCCQSAAFGVLLLVLYSIARFAPPAGLDWDPAASANLVIPFFAAATLWSLGAAFDFASRRLEKANRYSQP
jgi:hypothetical protein